MEAFCLQKSCPDTWRSSSWFMRGQVNMADEAKLHSPVYSTFETLVVWCAVEENWAHSVDQCWLQALQFLVHLTDLLSVLLRCNSFTRIQKAVVDQTGSIKMMYSHICIRMYSTVKQQSSAMWDGYYFCTNLYVRALWVFHDQITSSLKTLLKTSLLRYSHTIQFTFLKCAVKWLLVFHVINLKIFW